MPQIKCVKCHQNIDSSNKFCPYCGALVQPDVPGENLLCPKCGHQNTSDSLFCEECGASLKADTPSEKSQKQQTIKTYSSTGNYSGTMVKSKSSKSYKIFKTIILTLLVIGIIAFVIWYNNDPDAKEKLINVLFSIGFMLVFGIFVWLRNRGVSKEEYQRRRRKSDLDKLYDKDNMDDDDDDDDDDFDDDFDDD